MKKEVLETLENYLNELENEHKQHKDKYRKERPGDCGFHYERNIPREDKNKLHYIKEKKLHIKRLIKLIKEEC